MKKKIIIYSTLISLGLYVFTFVILVQLGGREEIRLKEKNGKFDIKIVVQAPKCFVKNNEATFLATLYYPFYNLSKNIEVSFWREFQLASEEENRRKQEQENEANSKTPVGRSE